MKNDYRQLIGTQNLGFFNDSNGLLFKKLVFYQGDYLCL
jgi:hypothetical protein